MSATVLKFPRRKDFVCVAKKCPECGLLPLNGWHDSGCRFYGNGWFPVGGFLIPDSLVVL